MEVFFLAENGCDDAEETLYSEDESVLVNIVRNGWSEMREALYSCVVYARYEWQRVDDPATRQWMYEYRFDPSRDGLPWEEAVAYARGLVSEPSGI